jgi:hypothetical protein
MEAPGTGPLLAQIDRLKVQVGHLNLENNQLLAFNTELLATIATMKREHKEAIEDLEEQHSWELMGEDL